MNFIFLLCSRRLYLQGFRLYIREIIFTQDTSILDQSYVLVDQIIVSKIIKYLWIFMTFVVTTEYPWMRASVARSNRRIFLSRQS